MTENSFKKGIKDGLPICFGYMAVSFAFGISTYSSGFGVLQCLLISMTCVTSAGQFAGVPIMLAGGTLFELAASQFIINLRYSLMSISLSQKLDKSVSLIDRFIIAFMDTDEIFAVASSKDGNVGMRYLLGLIITPWLGWASGTGLGAVLGNILPEVVVDALGLAIYAMFIAIVVPPAKESRPVALCSILAIALSCCFKYISVLSNINSGFVIIICAIVASAVCAIVAPVEDDSNEKENDEGGNK